LTDGFRARSATTGKNKKQGQVEFPRRHQGANRDDTSAGRQFPAGRRQLPKLVAEFQCPGPGQENLGIRTVATWRVDQGNTWVLTRNRPATKARRGAYVATTVDFPGVRLVKVVDLAFLSDTTTTGSSHDPGDGQQGGEIL